ncbi:minor capsid protein [Streptococcus parasuis]
MKNSSYWKKRFELLEQLEHDKASILLQELESHYLKAQRELDGQILTWHKRFAVNNNISMAEARKLLTTKELAEFKWDVKEYIKYGQENEVNPIWMQQLENASARYHVSRLEALKIQTQQSLEVLFGNQLDDVDSLMKRIYSEGYYHTAYEMQNGFNIGWDIASIDQKKLERIISRPWTADGQNFSSRIWNNKSKLVNEVHAELTQMAILGKAPDQAIKNIAAKMNTSKSNAGRLVMTESAYFASVSQKDAFNDLDVEQFEIVATLDSHTSEICRGLDGHVFDMKDYEAGVTAPPFHPWCRTTTVPFFDDEFNLGERAVRDEETGKTYYVPSNMTYPQWKAKFVDGGDKEGLKKVDPGDIIKKNEPSEAAKELLKQCEVNNVEYKEVQKLQKALSSNEIIEKLAGGDMTKGSCSSLGFAYIGNRNGLDVIDFRGGSSQSVFSRNSNIKKMLELPGVNGSITMVKKEISGTMEVLKGLESNKEYYLATGKHAAIVRKVEEGFEYLELQSKAQNGWMPFDRYGSIAATLNKRFGCRKTVDRSYGQVWEKSVILMDVNSFNGNTDFEQILGYINTLVENQQKGVMGDVK